MMLRFEDTPVQQSVCRSDFKPLVVPASSGAAPENRPGDFRTVR